MNREEKRAGIRKKKGKGKGQVFGRDREGKRAGIWERKSAGIWKG